MDFEQLYNAYYMKVYSYVMTLTRDQSHAEELTQKAFFKAITTQREFRNDAQEFTWLCAIAKNLFIDQTREQKHCGELPRDMADDSNVEAFLEDTLTVFRIHRTLHAMEEPYKEVFQLRVFGELSFQKIGLLFGKSENWSRVTYHRARLKIQERMEKNEAFLSND